MKLLLLSIYPKMRLTITYWVCIRKVVELAGAGSAINWATLVYFLLYPSNLLTFQEKNSLY